MYFDAQAAPRQPRAQALRDETEHEPNQKGGRGYSAALGTGASARESRWAYAIPLTGAVLAQVVGEGDAELQRPAVLSAATTGLHNICKDAGDSFPLTKCTNLPSNHSTSCECRGPSVCV